MQATMLTRDKHFRDVCDCGVAHLSFCNGFLVSRIANRVRKRGRRCSCRVDRSSIVAWSRSWSGSQLRAYGSDQSVRQSLKAPY
jgi:hypothetical protein